MIISFLITEITVDEEITTVCDVIYYLHVYYMYYISVTYINTYQLR